MRRSVITLLLFVVTLGLWEGAMRALRVPVYLVPPPSLVVERLVQGLASGRLIRHTLVTGAEILAGYALGAAVGITLGVLIAQYHFVEEVVYPYVVALNSVPKVAIAPLLVVWFGVGFQSKIIICALVSFFPLLVNVITGLRAVDAEQLDLMRAITASRWQTFRLVQLPTALPSIFAGLEVAIVLSVVGAIVGEFVGAKEGLGYFILLSNALVDTAGMFASFIILAALGWILSQLVKVIARRVVFWRRTELIVESA